MRNKDQNELLNIRGINLPIGAANVRGDIEDFVITIYCKEGATYRFSVKGGNICTCNNSDVDSVFDYEVR